MNPDYFTIAKDIATTEIGRKITTAEWDAALPAAMKKLSNIIAREGDSDGIRTKPDYLGYLIVEAIDAYELFNKCVADDGKEKAT